MSEHAGTRAAPPIPSSLFRAWKLIVSPPRDRSKRSSPASVFRLPWCGSRSRFKAGGATARAATSPGARYDRARTYRAGQSMTHPVFGQGEVTAVLDSQKIEVLFPDRLRRLIHARA